MGRRKAYAPLAVMINNRLLGQLTKKASGAIAFQYDKTWLGRDPAFAISLSLPLREDAYSGAVVAAVFDNLLPDNPGVRLLIAESMCAQGTDYFSLLEVIGRDCVGAMQFLAGSSLSNAPPSAEGRPMAEASGHHSDHAYPQAATWPYPDRVRADRHGRQRRQRALLPQTSQSVWP